MTPQERATALAADLYQRGMYEEKWIEPIRVAIVEATNEEINRRRRLEIRRDELETQLKAVTNELRRLQIEREERLAPSEKLSAEIEELVDAAAGRMADSIDKEVNREAPVAPAGDCSFMPLNCAPHVCQLCDRPVDQHKYWIQRHERWAKELG